MTILKKNTGNWQLFTLIFYKMTAKIMHTFVKIVLKIKLKSSITQVCDEKNVSEVNGVFYMFLLITGKIIK